MSEYTFEGVPFSDDELQERIRAANETMKQINAIDQSPKNPAELARKVTLYTFLQGSIGDLYAQAVYNHSEAYLDRKQKFAEWRDMFHGTEKAKDDYAEKNTEPLKRIENRAKANAKRWESQYNNAEQKANAIKKELEILFDDYRQGGRT